MDRDFRQGYLELTAPTLRLRSPWQILKETFRLFGSRFGFIAMVTLVVYVPGHVLYQLVAATLEIPSSGILSFLLLDVVDLVLSSLTIPAIIYGLVRSPEFSPALRWARRQWLRTLGKQLLVDITVVLWGALLIVPGLIAMVRLALVPVIVAVEGDQVREPLERSRALAKGHVWRIVAVLLPLGLVDAAVNFLLLGRISGVDSARVLFTVAESGIAIVGQLSTVAALLIYLGVVESQTPIIQKKTAKL